MNRILTVAGSDSCGGAGVQADIKTASALGTDAACVITALTAQSADAVYAVLETPPEMVAGQLDAVFSLLKPGAVKIGMVPTAAAAAVIAGKLAEYGAKNIVLDPLSAATAGTRLASEEAAAEAERRLFPLARLLTPNLPEAAALALRLGVRVTPDRKGAERAADLLAQRYGCAVLVKGGHAETGADDLLRTEEGLIWLEGTRLPGSAHGTGCALSSAIACRLAAGDGLEEAVRTAKRFITGALTGAEPCGRSALLNFFWRTEDRASER